MLVRVADLAGERGEITERFGQMTRARVILLPVAST